MGEVLFHLAFPVHDLKEAKIFYVEGLGCKLGRESSNALILDLKGHQIVAHLVDEALPPPKGIYPRHFGLVFKKLEDWEALLHQAQGRKLCFYQEPRVRFPDSPLEHRTFFLQDPSGNLMELKHYKFPSAIFGGHDHSQVGDQVT